MSASLMHEGITTEGGIRNNWIVRTERSEPGGAPVRGQTNGDYTTIDAIICIHAGDLYQMVAAIVV
jgi:hypothetical protein